MTTRASLPGVIRALVALVVLVQPACSPSSDPSCGAPHATFHLVVKAAKGPVPGDIVIAVKHGSGEEAFDARHPDDTPKVVFCRLEFADDLPDASAGDAGDAAALDAQADGPGGPRDDGDAGGPKRTIARVVCDLWTDGAADVRVTAAGYPEVERELSADRDECGIVMTEVEIELERAD